MASLQSRTWQRWMIQLAGNARLTRFLQGNRWTAGMAERFVRVGDASVLAQAAHQLHEAKLLTSIYYLGEYVTQAELIEENVSQILRVIETAGQSVPELFVCIDPTQIGYALSDEVGLQNALRIGELFKRQPNAKFLMVDMEDHTFVQRTIDLYWRLKKADVPTAITLQSYLHRTPADIEQITQTSAAIRLVKGAFVADKSIAHTSRAAIRAAYLSQATRLLQPDLKARGVYPIFATHDDRIISQLQPIIRQHGWQADEYEFEMLLGVRDGYQRQLAAAGYPVRVYVPFGTEWWAYTARRIGENPANVGFALRAIVGRG